MSRAIGAAAPPRRRCCPSPIGANAPWNETHWNNEKFEKLLADARGETDEAKRKPYIWEMQAMLSEDGGALIPVFRDWLDAHNDKVGGHTPTGGFDMDNGMILDKAWLKSELGRRARGVAVAGQIRAAAPSLANPGAFSTTRWSSSQEHQCISATGGCGQSGKD